jgi:hypothetical protein
MPRSGHPVASKCSRCGAAILWCKTERDRRMPVDYLPSTGGNLLVDTDGRERRVRVLGPLELSASTPGTLHKAHQATCPARKAQR